MFIKYVPVICIIISFNINAQYLDRSFGYFDDVPTARFNMWGIGSLGFDSKANYYNPNYFSAENTLGVFLYGNINLHSSRKYNGDEQWDNSTSRTEENTNIIPNISAYYKLDNFLFNLSYLNTLYFNRKVKDESGEIHTNYYFGSWLIYYRDPHIRIKNNVFQLSISMKLSNYTSIAVGLATNVFKYEFSSNQIEGYNNIFVNDSYEFGSDLFSNYQYLLSINYRNPEILSLYIFYKTQYTNTPLGPSELPVNDSLYLKINPRLTIPGKFGFGTQVRIIDPLRVSAEFSGDVIFEEDEGPDIYNTNISLGLNYRLLDKLQLGFMALYYFDYFNGFILFANGTRRDHYYFPDYYYKPESDFWNSFNLIFNSSYRLMNDLELFFGYQYSKITTRHYTDITGVIYLGVYYGVL